MMHLRSGRGGLHSPYLLPSYSAAGVREPDPERRPRRLLYDPSMAVRMRTRWGLHKTATISATEPVRGYIDGRAGENCLLESGRILLQLPPCREHQRQIPGHFNSGRIEDPGKCVRLIRPAATRVLMRLAFFHRAADIGAFCMLARRINLCLGASPGR